MLRLQIGVRGPSTVCECVDCFRLPIGYLPHGYALGLWPPPSRAVPQHLRIRVQWRVRRWRHWRKIRRIGGPQHRHRATRRRRSMRLRHGLRGLRHASRVALKAAVASNTASTGALHRGCGGHGAWRPRHHRCGVLLLVPWVAAQSCCNRHAAYTYASDVEPSRAWKGAGAAGPNWAQRTAAAAATAAAATATVASAVTAAAARW